MKYEKLNTLFYKLDRIGYEAEYTKRKTSYGSLHTSLPIRAFRKGTLQREHFELFYVMIPELISLQNNVLLNSGKIQSLVEQLPPFAAETYFDRLIVNDAQSNNEIEGVRSTKKELSDVLQRLHEPNLKMKNFTGMMKTYKHIEDIGPFHSLIDFRNLYDELVADEISKQDIPDGRYFRKGDVSITDGSKITHIGLPTEDKITEALFKLMQFLQDEAHPELFRYLIAHYYYEYIHPFYDGNGRTGRLLVGSYLAKYLERYSAVTFSYIINKDKNKYYKALEEVPSPMNRGEVTFYLHDMLELLIAGQQNVIDDLSQSLLKYTLINKTLLLDSRIESTEERTILLYALMISVFSSNKDIEVTEIMSLTGYSRYKVNKVFEKLESEKRVVLKSARPKTYSLDSDQLFTSFEY